MVYQIILQWVEGLVIIVKSGDVFIVEWCVNVNDDVVVLVNDFVDNVIFIFVIENGMFEELLSLCLIFGVDFVLSILVDGKIMVCNIGIKDEGILYVIQILICVDGEIGFQLIGLGIIDGVLIVLMLVDIVNDFGMDICWVVVIGYLQISGVGIVNLIVDFGLQWMLSKDFCSEVGLQIVIYDLQILLVVVMSIVVGVDWCMLFIIGVVNGYLWLGGVYLVDQMVDFVIICMIQQFGLNLFCFMLIGIDYDLMNLFMKDFIGVGLFVDQVVFVSGMIWFWLVVIGGGLVNLSFLVLMYILVVGIVMVQDDFVNNIVSKIWMFFGVFIFLWLCVYIGFGGFFYGVIYVVVLGI